jgi:hypothetical protein
MKLAHDSWFEAAALADADAYAETTADAYANGSDAHADDNETDARDEEEP